VRNRTFIYAGRTGLLAALLFLAAGPVGAQGPLGNLLGDELIDPRPGIYAWYEVEDAKTGQVLFMRQAIVGEERVGRRDGYWLEIEILPREGFPAIYKMLVTGPANERDHLHQVIAKPGAGPRVELPVAELFADEQEPPTPERLGEETVSTQQGEIPCVRYAIEQADGSTVQVFARNNWTGGLAVDPVDGSFFRPHHVNPASGMYRGRQVIEVED